MEKLSERLNQTESNLVLGVTMATKVYSVEGGWGGAEEGVIMLCKQRKS